MAITIAITFFRNYKVNYNLHLTPDVVPTLFEDDLRLSQKTIVC